MFRLSFRSLLIVYVLYFAVAAMGLVALRLEGYQLLSIQSGSMRPVLQRGDAVLIKPSGLTDLRPGEIISYRRLDDPGVLVSHRLVALGKGQATTAGDALGSHDPSISEEQIIGRDIARLPGLGRVLDFLRRPLGLFVAIYLPAAIFISFELRRTFMLLSRPRYRLVNQR